MQHQTVRQLQGAVDLLRDAVQGTAVALGAAHAEIAGQPYNVLRRIPLVSRPAGAVESMQRDITRLVYRSVGAVAGAAACAAALLLQAAQAE